MRHNKSKPLQLKTIEEEPIKEKIIELTETALKDAGCNAVSKVFSEAVGRAFENNNFNEVGTLIDIVEKCGIDVRVNSTNNKTTEM